MVKRKKPKDECRVGSCLNKGTISYGLHSDGRDYLVCEQCDKNVKRMLEYGVVV